MTGDDERPRLERILVSSCLLGERVRYDGADANAASAALDRWQAEGRLVPFCPEVAGGLPVPRPPAEIDGGDEASRRRCWSSTASEFSPDLLDPQSVGG